MNNPKPKETYIKLFKIASFLLNQTLGQDAENQQAYRDLGDATS